MHMTPQFVTGDYYVVNGTDYFPNMDDAIDHATEILKDTEVYVSVEKETGTIGRLSAIGYLDCTAWSPYDSEADAKAELFAETRGYDVFTLPARFASAAINNDWSSSELTDEDHEDYFEFIKMNSIFEFVDIIDEEPYFSWRNDFTSFNKRASSIVGDNVVRYIARVDETANTEL